jgi:hypothetical protein
LKSVVWGFHGKFHGRTLAMQEETGWICNEKCWGFREGQHAAVASTTSGSTRAWKTPKGSIRRRGSYTPAMDQWLPYCYIGGTLLHIFLSRSSLYLPHSKFKCATLCPTQGIMSNRQTSCLSIK